MTFLSLKAVATFISAVALTQAAPLAALPCSGDACNQYANSGNVNLGSTTNITPVTNITPITRYQPIVRTFAPIVRSQCRTGYESSCGNDFGDFDDFDYLNSDYTDSPYSGLGNLNRVNPNDCYYAANVGQLRNPYGRLRLTRRSDDDQISDQEPELSSPLFSQLQSDSCQAGQPGCETSIPDQNVDLGSQVEIQPTNQVLPSTTYQNHVQALDANIQAAQAQSSSLSQQNVNLGSNVNIQPATHVLPQTTYQPSVSQLSASIEAEPQQDQSLPHSSVQLGSNVNIAPNVQVRPLTTFQPSISSLPFIINVEPCDSGAISSPSAFDDSFSSLPTNRQDREDFESPMMIPSGNSNPNLLDVEPFTAATTRNSQVIGLGSNAGCL
ncbi:hypothetical protein BGZ76_006380 [Entomortierella beljakovae]|nr:hypothetical protein BGZ76_006380 [Entomortierella beljakovae]